MSKRPLMALLVALALPALAHAAEALPPEAVELFKRVDTAARVGGDSRSVLVVEEKLEGGRKVLREGVSFSRSVGRKFVFIVTSPKTEVGGGYLKIDQNLWSFDAKLGRWERRTERETLSGTNLRRSDLDERHLGDDYELVGYGKETEGGVALRKLQLKAKEDAAVAFPGVAIYVDDSNIVRKQQDFALSGKLLRTTYVRKVGKTMNKTTNTEFTYPADIRILDEVDKERVTSIVVKSIAVEPQDDNTFTKGYFETKTR